MGEYRRRQAVVEAVHFVRGRFESTTGWLQRAFDDGRVQMRNGAPVIKTTEYRWGNDGDWLVRDELGNLSWVPEADFYEMYEQYDGDDWKRQR